MNVLEFVKGKRMVDDATAILMKVYKEADEELFDRSLQNMATEEETEVLGDFDEALGLLFDALDLLNNI